MSKYGHPDFPSEEVDLAKSGNFDKTHPTQPEQSNLSDQIGDDRTPGFTRTHEDEALISRLTETHEDEDLEIPKFLLKNNIADTAAFEEDKFANRSMKMVQDAVRTLSEDGNTATAPAPLSGAQEAMATANVANQQNAGSRRWKVPATFAMVALGIGGYFAFQSGNLDGIASFAQKRDLQPVLTDSGYSARDNNQSAVSGRVAVDNSNEAAKPAPVVSTATRGDNPAVKLDGARYDSLKARLGGNPATRSSTDKVATASVKRLQVAALVAEQAPPKPISTQSLKNVDASAAALEAEIANSANDTVPVQAVKVSPVQPAIQLAQASTPAGDRLKLLTNNVVNQLNKLKQFEENPESAEIPETQDLRNSINQLVQQAASQNLDSSAIEGLLQEALANTDAVPQALARADGKLDTRLLLMSVLSQVDSSQVKSSDQDYLAALDDEGSSTVIQTSLADAQAASSLDNSRIITVSGKKTIKVVIGDTLSKIAFAVYGDALTYTRIFKANRSQLKNPNLLTVGMVLALP